MNTQFLKFVFFSGIAAIVNITTRIVFNYFVSYELAILLAFFTALTTAFIFNKLFVFEQSVYKHWIIEYWFFFLVNLIGLLLTFGISLGLKDYLFIKINFNFYPETLAHIIGVGFPVLTSFIGHKFLSFKTVNTQ